MCHPCVGHLDQQVDLLLSLLVEVACQVARNQIRVVLEKVVGVVVDLAAVVRDAGCCGTCTGRWCSWSGSWIC